MSLLLLRAAKPRLFSNCGVGLDHRTENFARMGDSGRAAVARGRTGAAWVGQSQVVKKFFCAPDEESAVVSFKSRRGDC